MNTDQKSLETGFSIAICRPTGDKWQSKRLFLAIFDPHWFSIAAYPVCNKFQINKLFDKNVVFISIHLPTLSFLNSKEPSH